MGKRRIVLTGGGTGGHFYPLIAIAESVSASAKEPTQLYYMGPNPYDGAALASQNITFVSCPAGKRRKYASVANVADLFKTLFGVAIAMWKLFLIYPDVVMSKGGFTTVPVIVAAWFLRIPVVVHESDAVPGTANKLAARFARYVAISYDESAALFKKQDKVTLTGIPIRNQLLAPPSATARETLGLSAELPVILILGGSQGAERVNELILKTLDELLPHYSVIHQTGKELHEITAASAKALITDAAHLAHYHPIPFIEGPTLNEAMHSSHLIISRAGSGTIFEIAVHAKPSIIIPIPEEISHDQRKNAYAYARSGAATVMEEENLEESLLVAEINRIMSNQDLYGQMATAAKGFAPTDAGAKISDLLQSIAAEHW